MLAIGGPCRLLTGYEPADLIANRRIAYGDLLHPTDREAAWAEIRRAIAERRCYRAMYRIRVADRTEKRILDHGTPVFDAAGNPIALAGYLLDLAQSPIIEERELVGTLAAGMVHDLRNLLTVVSTGAELLGRKLEHEPTTLPDIMAVRSAAELGSCFAGQLIRVLRSQPLARELVELNETIAGLAPLLRTVIGERIELHVDFDQELGRVLANPTQIEQIVLNLMANARDAMPAGGTLTLTTRNLEVDQDQGAAVRAVRPGSYVVLAVADTGMGMDAETLPRIFEAAYSTKGSTGIGLTTVNEIVTRMGGGMRVSSSLGRGTVFEALLPRCDCSEQNPVSQVVAK
jgi:signal transduction histidine kinase